ncbi:hypothetical protein ED733_000775 [Metarhizium rileyi]|uniref:DUF7703 domain-containing protein n=1 Tax=Metarhizium rileyi (strain RCEF 4871) TaxID=1649241 RepID=A0A5C6GC56_METRR|nr:hypothetical protein ED733_000775 [Metarhizium rileyi]
MEDIKSDLVTSMTMAAFLGIAWYISIEMNVTLFVVFKRRHGMYFWSCALSSWGIILQCVLIVLADFGVWKDLLPAIILIYLTWCMMVVPQGWMLYSRLHLLMQSKKTLLILKYIILFNSVVFSIPTMVIGTLAQATTVNPNLMSINLVWDRIQLIVFFAQETTLSMLYLLQTRKYLKNRQLLQQRHTPSSSQATNRSQPKEQKAILWQVVYINILVLALQVALLGIQCANLFYLQSAIKPGIYAIKLKLEFVALNQLIHTVTKPNSAGMYLGSQPKSTTSRHSVRNGIWHKSPAMETGEDNDAIQLVDAIAMPGSISDSAERKPAHY